MDCSHNVLKYALTTRAFGYLDIKEIASLDVLQEPSETLSVSYVKLIAQGQASNIRIVQQVITYVYLTALVSIIIEITLLSPVFSPAQMEPLDRRPDNA